jgi:hypothetical protein
LKRKVLEFDGVDDKVEIDSHEEAVEWVWEDIKRFPRALSNEEIAGLCFGYIKPLKCRRCNFWFTSRSELMRHIWEWHRIRVLKEA